MSDCRLFDELQRQAMRRCRRDQQNAAVDLEVDRIALQLPRGRIQIGDGQPRRAKTRRTVGGQTRQPTGDLKRAEHGDPLACLSDRQSPGASSAALSVMRSRKAWCAAGSGADITTSITRKAPLGWRW